MTAAPVFDLMALDGAGETRTAVFVARDGSTGLIQLLRTGAGIDHVPVQIACHMRAGNANRRHGPLPANKRPAERFRG